MFYTPLNPGLSRDELILVRTTQLPETLGARELVSPPFV
jgi:hypothetical protein